ncbi:MAG: 3-oxoacyl-ACP reductase FabG [Clostridia bacterium]|nr:3-oxoacyl-ACP reductase FabG [Clostridia bacterium]
MKTVLVTGGARGIGRAISEKFAKNGYNVIVNYSKSEEAAYALAQEYSNIRTFKADISNKKDVKKMIEFADDEFKGVDILVNNAGISSTGLLQDLSEEELNRIFAVNVNGSIFCAQSVLPNMISKKSGKIINISSVWGMVGASNEVAYSASKAAIIGFTKALAKEVGPSNIHVNCVAPGIIMTDMVSDYTVEEFDDIRSNIPLDKIGSTEDIANIVYFLATDEANYITGQVISPNGGWVI